MREILHHSDVRRCDNGTSARQGLKHWHRSAFNQRRDEHVVNALIEAGHLLSGKITARHWPPCSREAELYVRKRHGLGQEMLALSACVIRSAYNTNLKSWNEGFCINAKRNAVNMLGTVCLQNRLVLRRRRDAK